MESMEDRVLQLDPETIIAKNNVRHGLLQTKIETLKASILEAGGVIEPVVIYYDEKERPVLWAGFYRHAATLQANLEGAGLTLPCIVRSAPTSDADRLKLQVIENVNRSEMSPMDEANAIRGLLDSGVPMDDVKKMFPRPGGKKGAGMAPASEGWIYTTLALLKLNKSIQEKVHDGRVAPTAAYELAKIQDKDMQAKVLARAEKSVQSIIDREQKDAAKFETQAQKEQRLREKEEAKAREAKELEANIKQLRLDVKAAEGLVKERQKEQKLARTKPYDADNEGETKAWQESLKAADKNLSGAKSAHKKLQNDLAKAIKKQNDAKEKAAAAEVEVVEPIPGKTKGKGSVGPAAVKAAAKEEGANTKFVALKLSEVRAGLKDISKDSNVRISGIAKIMLQMIDGELTPKLVIEALKSF